MRVSRVQAEENRQKVINAASRLFRENGFDGIGLANALSGSFDGMVEYVQGVDLPFLFRISVLFAMARWVGRLANPSDVIVMNEDSLWLVPHLRKLTLFFRGSC